MGKFWIGIFLLLLLLGFGLWTGSVMENIHRQMANTLTVAADTAVAGDMPGAMETAARLREQWQRRRNWVAIVADHTPIDEIDSLFAQLEIYGKGDATAEFSACCSQVAQLVKAVGEAHSLNWWNLL